MKIDPAIVGAICRLRWVSPNSHGHSQMSRMAVHLLMDDDNLVLARRRQQRRRRRRRCELVLVVEARCCRVRLQVLSADGKVAPDPGLLFSRTACAVRRDVPGRFASTSKDATDGCHAGIHTRTITLKDTCSHMRVCMQTGRSTDRQTNRQTNSQIDMPAGCACRHRGYKRMPLSDARRVCSGRRSCAWRVCAKRRSHRRV